MNCLLVIVFGALSLLSSTEGGRKKDRIIEGREASIDEFPYQISIETAKTHMCGGSIIHPRIVLTAAHCLVHFKKQRPMPMKILSVRAGTSTSQRGGQHLEIDDYHIHEKYNDDDEVDKYDIALIKLSEPIKLSDKAQVVTLSKGTPKIGTKAFVSGYGSQVRRRSISKPEQLMAVELPVMDINKCIKIMKRKDAGIANDMICAGYPSGHRDSCQGDSGGPFVVNNVQIGVVAWGLGCGVEGSPGIYTNLHKYRKWVKSTSARLLNVKRSALNM